ncbi:MAG: DinB family protein [Phycisphaerales bacterium]|nr:DinB family protein [Phycisphaerales bacterium]
MTPAETQPPPPADTAIRAMLDVHAMTLSWIRAAVDDVPDARMTAQFGPIVNHPAWTLAHLSAYAAAVLEMFDDPDASATDDELARFGYGTLPVADPSVYPSKTELLDTLTRRHERVASVVARKHAEYFARPAPEKFSGATTTIGQVAMLLMVPHETYHLGQLMQWRRAAGIAPKT